jgi:two-component system nitrate/nitrite sensor histidine kinase NarX
MNIPQLTNEQIGVLRFGSARMALLDIEAGFWSIRGQLEALIGSPLTDSVLQQAGANGGASFAKSMGQAKDDEEKARFFEACLKAYQTAGFGAFEILDAHWPIGRIIIRARETFESWMTSQHGQQAEVPVCSYSTGVLVGFVNMIAARRDVVCIERQCQALGYEFCEFELLPSGELNDQTVVAFLPDPKLGRQVNLLEMLFERMPMGIAVVDRDFRLVRCNPTWVSFIEQYTPSETIQVVPGSGIFDLEPGMAEILIPLFDKVFTGETICQDSVRIELGGIESFWDVVLSPLYEGEKVVGLLNVSIDATKRVEAEKQLEETLARLNESESMLRSIVENAQHFAIYRIEIDPSNPYLGKVVLVSPSIRELTGIENPYCFEKWFENLHPDDYDRIIEANRRSLETGTTYNHSARFFNASENRWRWVQTISNPGYDTEGRLTHFDGMIIDLTNQKEAELALQEINAKLEERVNERTRELQTLLEVTDAANKSLDLDETLISTLNLLVNLDSASRAGVMLRSETTGKLEAHMIIPVQTISPEELARIITSCEVVATKGEPFYIIPDLAHGFVEPGAFLPLRVRDRILGVLVIIGSEGRQFGVEEQALFKSIADQMGSAVENARLYGQAEQSAITMERNRLARNLHDAVTQTLFSASLIAEVLPKLWERNPEVGRQKLEELRQLTRGAISEMRTLLLELRPAVLSEINLGDLLRHLANAFTGRTRIPVKMTLDGQVDPLPNVKEVFYRVAQEALNNINKHAEATQTSIYLKRLEKQTEMRIQDNGRGFNLLSIAPENLGLTIMRERADSIDAKLTIESQIGEGVSIELIWKENLE